MIIHDQIFFLRASVVFATKFGRSRKSFEHFCNILVKKQKQIHPISTASICSKCLCLPEKIQIKVRFKERGVGGIIRRWCGCVWPGRRCHAESVVSGTPGVNWGSAEKPPGGRARGRRMRRWRSEERDTLCTVPGRKRRCPAETEGKLWLTGRCARRSWREPAGYCSQVGWRRGRTAKARGDGGRGKSPDLAAAGPPCRARRRCVESRGARWAPGAALWAGRSENAAAWSVSSAAGSSRSQTCRRSWDPASSSCPSRGSRALLASLQNSHWAKDCVW